MLTSALPRLRRRFIASLVSACMVAAISPADVAASALPVDSQSATASAPAGDPPLGEKSEATSPAGSLSFPAGEAAGGGTVSWTVDSARRTSFRSSSGWWGAASTRIKIRGPQAPHVYAFHMQLPRHVRLATNRFGEVLARRHGHRVGIIGRPWARNAGGHRIRTWYTVHDRVVRQHVAFGRHSRFPIRADPWWNPFTWQWGEAFSVAWREVTTCGRGAMDAVLSVGGTTGLTNLLLKHVAGKAALMIPGGAYTYAGFAAWGCLGSFF